MTPNQHNPEREARTAAGVGDERNGRNESVVGAAPAGWRSIESAPRDESWILLVERTKGGAYWALGVWASSLIRTGWFHSTGKPISFNPTHWMPLPPPPSAAAPSAPAPASPP